MPPIFLVDTGAGSSARVIAPPHSGYCPPSPADVVAVGPPLYNHTEVFFVGGLTLDTPNPLRGHRLPEGHGVGVCAPPDAFYTKYVNAYANDTTYKFGLPVIGSSAAPDAALLSASQTIAEYLRQLDSRRPGLRAKMVSHYQRFAVWADSERRHDTCDYCKKKDPSFDCGPHIDSRPGRDTSYHPEVPYCVEGGGADKGMATTFTEEYGICYLLANGSVPASYSGTQIVAHEFFHSVHEVAIRNFDPEGFALIEQACARAFRQGIYHFHPGAPPDPEYTADFTTGMVYECMVKAVMTWHGFPANKSEFLYQSRSELKQRAPWFAAVVHRYFEDSDWNPCEGVRIDNPRDQTWGLTCTTAPGSALCGKRLSNEYIGPPMETLEAPGTLQDVLLV